MSEPPRADRTNKVQPPLDVLRPRFRDGFRSPEPTVGTKFRPRPPGLRRGRGIGLSLLLAGTVNTRAQGGSAPMHPADGDRPADTRQSAPFRSCSWGTASPTAGICRCGSTTPPPSRTETLPRRRDDALAAGQRADERRRSAASFARDWQRSRGRRFPRSLNPNEGSDLTYHFSEKPVRVCLRRIRAAAKVPGLSIP